MKISGIQNDVEKLSRNPLTRADIENPLNSRAIQRILYLSSDTDGRIENGEGEIRTHGPFGSTVFKTAAFGHSATSPEIWQKYVTFT